MLKYNFEQILDEIMTLSFIKMERPILDISNSCYYDYKNHIIYIHWKCNISSFLHEIGHAMRRKQLTKMWGNFTEITELDPKIVIYEEEKAWENAHKLAEHFKITIDEDMKESIKTYKELTGGQNGK